MANTKDGNLQEHRSYDSYLGLKNIEVMTHI